MTGGPSLYCLIPTHRIGAPMPLPPPEALAITTLKPPRLLSRLTSRRTAAREDLLTGPIRGELLGAEHLGERAQDLAEGQRLSARPARRRTPLLARLNGTRRILDDAQARLTSASDRG